MELNIPADLSYKSSRDQLRKYFVDFLGRLEIPSDCFKNDSNRWCFNRDGKELFIDFCKHRSEKYSEENKDFVYRDLRKKITHEECIGKYAWIADCVCSNLQYNIIHSESPEDYPTEEDVSIKMENFFMHALPSIDNPLKLPGIIYLLNAIKEQKNFLLFSELTKDVLHSAPEDIEFIADPIHSEFSAIYSDFFKKRDAAVKKWVYYISQFKEYRDTEHQILMDTTTPEEEETIDALLQPITSVYDLSPSKEYAPASSYPQKSWRNFAKTTTESPLF